jgi:hypothetical protein
MSKATDVVVSLFAPEGVSWKGIRGRSGKRNMATKSIGNALLKTSIALDLDLRNLLEERPHEILTQVKIEYTRLDGAKCMRAVTLSRVRG